MVRGPVDRNANRADDPPASGEPPLQPRPRTLVDIRWKNAQKVSLSLTFEPARRDPDVSGLDPQSLSFQADRT